MAIESAADRAVFFDTNDFAVSITWTLAAGGETALAVIVDDSFEETDLPVVGDASMAQARLILAAATADLPTGAAAGDTVTLDGVTYEVMVIEDDGTGVTSIQADRIA